jgi:hypothetical protein
MKWIVFSKAPELASQIKDFLFPETGEAEMIKSLHKLTFFASSPVSAVCILRASRKNIALF